VVLLVDVEVVLLGIDDDNNVRATFGLGLLVVVAIAVVVVVVNGDTASSIILAAPSNV
jgi:hypothetical protein